MQMFLEHYFIVRLKRKDRDVQIHIGVEERSWARVSSLRDISAHLFRAACLLGKSARLHDILEYKSKTLMSLYQKTWVFCSIISTRSNWCISAPYASTATVSDMFLDIVDSTTGGRHGIVGETGCEVTKVDIEDLFNMLTPTTSIIECVLVRVTLAAPEETYESTYISQNGFRGGSIFSDV